ncbi:UvrD-helicase domain-containing protein [Alloacidobacterium dinghuense]|uniref:DNA 3'-5' helicase n=1 Tax=Alloacidobacterium dinghuense TaxID=2763107 RepID=A0A7G8BM17_9BACT|nr:UvrD-helicase domain-containing protein [Alloacidobacterium dinghuense]QNI33587.1 UvrD-helicase domain-containing protein [Alloacidobacterium dinghuense]
MPDLRLTPPDQGARDEALSTEASYIVQAPAGSGKTELLTHRFLKLLAHVDEPEQILAITFTRAATAEMRSRVLKKLEEAASSRVSDADDVLLVSARAALAHAEKRGWNLLDQPHRLDIQTIDSLCMRVAHEQPLLARMGGQLQPQENALPLYQNAARRTLANLGGRNRELHAALTQFLQLRDNNLQDTQRLIAEMLAHRDQWIHTLPLNRQLTAEDWDEARLQFEAPFRRAINRVLRKVHTILSSEAIVADELVELASYAARNQSDIDLRAISHIRTLPGPNEKFFDQWICICCLLLTKSNDAWRKQVTAKEGFPPSTIRRKDSVEQQYKDRMMSLIGRLSQYDGLRESLCAIRNLPPPRYDSDQWQTLRNLFTVLHYAAAELRVLFAEENAVDFVELGISALHVLEQEHPSERVLSVSERVRHLLVDEFQDTSRRQHLLVRALLRAWNQGDGRTCFFVGDPMQSIYMFRQAEVELFEQVRQHGVVTAGQQHPCTPLQLTANFRSHGGLTDPLNDYFDKIFARTRTAGAAAVPFSASQAVSKALPGKSIHLHPQFVPRGDEDALAEAREHEAEQLLCTIQEHLPRVQKAALTADPDKSYTVAVLARARQHLALIAQKLHENNIPFRSVELETLSERQEILDLLSLIRALLHPMDRIAWLSVLRAPWCGLTLQDLYILCGSDDKQFALHPVQQLIEERLPLLSEDGQERLRRTYAVLTRALEVRYRMDQSPSLAGWIERVWHSLGGPLCLDEQQRENVRVFFTMLDTVAPDGIECLSEGFDHKLSRLFSQPDPRASERFGVQLMTIHKAKGLGFDVVLAPGLDRSTGRDRQQLICMLERVSIDNPDVDELLVAPIGSKGEDTHPLYQWVRKQRQMREDEERKRVFYVACTRARRELHLFGTAVIGLKGSLEPGWPDSLLATAWPALQTEFESVYQAQSKQIVIPFPSAPQPGVVDIAAVAAPAHPPLVLRRLPSDLVIPAARANVTVASTLSGIADDREPFERPEGSRQQRVIGSVIHALLERLSRLFVQNPGISGGEIRTLLQPQATTMLRAAAFPADQSAATLTDILAAAESSAADATGRWLLGPHPGAQSEASWTGWVDGRLQTLRADRVFRAGAEPLQEGSDYFWIVDYKTALYSGTDIEGFLAEQRTFYEPQLASYGRALCQLHGKNLALRFGLYFPRMGRFRHWAG